VEKWSGVLETTELPNLCAQVTTLGVFRRSGSVDEDCLYLNVYTTALGKGTKKPVLLWIHGGGNVDGAARDYDGSKLATGGPLGTDTVVVIVNYRLGLFGYLAHRRSTAKASVRELRIMDIQAALRWVQRNIEKFGGDPGNVAVGGQSAGAQDTAANMLSPLSAACSIAPSCRARRPRRCRRWRPASRAAWASRRRRLHGRRLLRRHVPARAVAAGDPQPAGHGQRQRALRHGSDDRRHGHSARAAAAWQTGRSIRSR
jgi:carboxylesterase type B